MYVFIFINNLKYMLCIIRKYMIYVLKNNSTRSLHSPMAESLVVKFVKQLVRAHLKGMQDL